MCGYRTGWILALDETGIYEKTGRNQQAEQAREKVRALSK